MYLRQSTSVCGDLQATGSGPRLRKSPYLPTVSLFSGEMFAEVLEYGDFSRYNHQGREVLQGQNLSPSLEAADVNMLICIHQNGTRPWILLVLAPISAQVFR